MESVRKELTALWTKRNWLLQSISLNNILNESSDMRDRIPFEPIPSSQKYLL